MSTISTEQAKDLRNAFECWQQDYDPVEDKEQYEMFGLGVVAMDELLALRKERERAEPKPGRNPVLAYADSYREMAKRGVESIPVWSVITDLERNIAPLYTAPPAPVVPVGWKLVPIEPTKEMLKQIHPFAEATCLDCGNQVVADCVDNVTASWNDMLAVAPEPCK